MKTLAHGSFALVLAAAVGGCATHDVGGDDGPGSGSGSGSNPTDPPRTIDAAGTYRLHSTFDLATNMPGTVGTVVNDFIAATDGPDDPMAWVLDQIIATLPSGTFKTVLVNAEPFVVGTLNTHVHDLAPTLVDTMLRVGTDVADVGKHFGLEETLAVTKPDQTYAGVVTADGVHLSVEGGVHDLKFHDYQLDDIVASGVAVALDPAGRLTIGEHHLPLAYGKILRMTLDAAIIPAIDPNATNLADLLAHVVDCQGVGQHIADALGFGSQAFWAAACTTGLQQGAQIIYDHINAIDASALDLDLTGMAHASDSNHDYELDTIDQGTWTGATSYAGTAAPLGGATFVGARM